MTVNLLLYYDFCIFKKLDHSLENQMLKIGQIKLFNFDIKEAILLIN